MLLKGKIELDISKERGDVMYEIHVFFAVSYERSDVYKLLESAVRQVYGIPMPKLTKDENGKPYFPDREDIHFSLSHSGKYIMCAVSDSPVGVDIQKEQKISDRTKKRIFTEKELENADPISLWCVKEGFIKLKGKLDRDYKEIEFIRHNDVFCGPEDTCGVILKEIAGYTAAVCSDKLRSIDVLVL